MKKLSYLLTLFSLGTLLIAGCSGNNNSSSSSKNQDINLGDFGYNNVSLTVDNNSLLYSEELGYYAKASNGDEICLSVNKGLMRDHFTSEYCNEEELKYLDSHKSVFSFLRLKDIVPETDMGMFAFVDPFYHVSNITVNYHTKNVGTYFMCLDSTLTPKMNPLRIKAAESGKAVVPEITDDVYLSYLFDGYAKGDNALLCIESIVVNYIAPIESLGAVDDDKTVYFYNYENWDVVRFKATIDPSWAREDDYYGYMVETEQKGWYKGTFNGIYRYLDFANEHGTRAVYGGEYNKDKPYRYNYNNYSSIFDAYKSNNVYKDITYFVYLEDAPETLGYHAVRGNIETEIDYTCGLLEKAKYDNWYKFTVSSYYERASVFNGNLTFSKDYKLGQGIYNYEDKWYQTFEDIAHGEKAINKRTLHFYNLYEWKDILAVAYDASGLNKRAEFIAMPTGEGKWYQVTIPGEVEAIMFSSNGTSSQGNTEIMLLGDENYYFNGWYLSKEEAEENNIDDEIDNATIKRLYFYDNLGFGSSITAMVSSSWNPIAIGGKKGHPVEGKEDWYYFDVETYFKTVIFSVISEQKQTPSIKIDFNNPYYKDGAWHASME